MSYVIKDSIQGNSFIKSGGTGIQYLMADGSVSTLSGSSILTGSGILNYLSKFNSINGLITSQLYDDGTNVAIGAGTVFTKLNIWGTSGNSGITSNAITQINQGIATSRFGVNSDGSYVFGLDTSVGATERIRISPNGNLLINTTTDNGVDKLQVNGSGNFASDSKINGITFGKGGGNQSLNIAIGNSVLGANTLGNQNIGIGAGALQNTTSNINLAIGINALNANTTGTGGVAIGNGALQSNNGSDTIGIGLNSGLLLNDGITPLTSSTQSIYIGRASKSFASSQSNEIVIGYNANGLGSNSVVLGNDSIVTTALKGNVGIGTTSPNMKLHISGASANTLKIDTAFDTSSCWFANTGILKGDINYSLGLNALNIRTIINSHIDLYTNASPRIRVDGNSGNILIGLTIDNTIDKLQVNGSLSAISATFKPTDTTGSVVIKNSRASDTSKIQEWKNIASATTASIDGNGFLILNRILAQSNTNDALVGFSSGGSGLVAIGQNSGAAGAVIENTAGGDIATFIGNNQCTIDNNANITANSFIKDGGTLSQFLMADGSVTEFKEYTAVINTTGTTIVPAVLYNTIGAIVWSNIGTGRWQGVLSGAFILNKCTFLANNGNASALGIVNVFRLDNNTIRLQTYDLTGTPANDIINQGSLTIKVFP